MMKSRPSISLPNRQSGVAIIESLVALLIVTIAMFGILNLQVRIFAETRSSEQRGVAIRLIEDFAERVKANPSQIPSYVIPWGPPQAMTANCQASGYCNATQLMQWDRAQWSALVASSLPGGQATVFPTPDPGQLGVMVAWEARTEGDGNTVYLAALGSPLTVPANGAAPQVDCPAGSFCHLSYFHR
jgi:type IV pilus assembly protein PilV